MNERNGLCKPFLYTEDHLKLPQNLILYVPQTSRAEDRKKHVSIYVSSFATLFAGILLIIIIFPNEAGAFWPFGNARAQVNTEPPVLHDTSINLLSAASNSDPNPTKGVLPVEVTGDTALIGNVGPDGTLPRSSGVTPGSNISLYQVREGDSLSAIADMFGVTTNTILWANDIKNAKNIRPGDTLLILPVTGIQHTVEKGDTLAKIAKKFEADAEEIALYNGLDNAVGLTVGTTLIIPGGDFTHDHENDTSVKNQSKPSSQAISRSLPQLTGFFANPLPGGRISQGLHGKNGIDIAAPNGTPIYAAADGIIIVSKNNGAYNGGYGNYVVISHDNGTQTLYGHMTRTAVDTGASVRQGDLIGYVGSTGRSTGNHLHFEVRGARNPFAN